LPHKASSWFASLFIRIALDLIQRLSALSTAQAHALLALAFLAARIFGWAATLAAWRHALGRIPICPDMPGGTADASAAAEIVRRTAARHPLNVECKERSLACWSLLRLRGRAANVVVGVDFYPFSSHCWCEYDGAILADFADRCARYVPVVVYA
jgi:hypothetical protein